MNLSFLQSLLDNHFWMSST